MQKMKCEVSVTDIGISAYEFTKENILILFGDVVGNGLEDYSIRIVIPYDCKLICTGDVFELGSHKHEVTSVGDNVMETFTKLGHCTLRFDGSTKPILPGTVHLTPEKGIPQLKVGDTIRIFSMESV